MATKTLTITEDAYNLLANDKLEDESFSEEITRIMTRKCNKHLSDFFGIISEKEGQEMLDDLNKIKLMNVKLLRQKVK